jgi:hypothetical protein
MVITSVDYARWQTAERLYLKHLALAQIYQEARKPDGSYDFSRASAFAHLDTEKACLEIIEQLTRELCELHAQIETYEQLAQNEQRHRQRLRGW